MPAGHRFGGPPVAGSSTGNRSAGSLDDQRKVLVLGSRAVVIASSPPGALRSARRRGQPIRGGVASVLSHCCVSAISGRVSGVFSVAGLLLSDNDALATVGSA